MRGSRCAQGSSKPESPSYAGAGAKPDSDGTSPVTRSVVRPYCQVGQGLPDPPRANGFVGGDADATRNVPAPSPAPKRMRMSRPASGRFAARLLPDHTRRARPQRLPTSSWCPPRPKPKAKSSAPTASGKNACRKPTLGSTPCAIIATAARSPPRQNTRPVLLLRLENLA